MNGLAKELAESSVVFQHLMELMSGTYLRTSFFNSLSQNLRISNKFQILWSCFGFERSRLMLYKSLGISGSGTVLM